MKTLRSVDQSMQVDVPDLSPKHKAGVYESIPNDKRCELIKKVRPRPGPSSGWRNLSAVRSRSVSQISDINRCKRRERS